MQAKIIQDKIAAETGFTVTFKHLGEVLGKKRLRSGDDVEDNYNEIIAKLRAAGHVPTPEGEIKWQEPKKTAKSKKGTTRGERTGETLPALRPRTHRLVNEEARAKLEILVAADREFRSGQPFRPTLKAFGALSFSYADPFDALIDDEFVSRRPNIIVIGQDENDRYRADPKLHYRWRSNEFLHMFERLLSGLWGEGICPGCHEPIISGFTGTAKDILSGKFCLPNTPGVPKRKEAKAPDYHDVCFWLRREKRDLDVLVQGKDENDPDTIAYRAEEYKAIVMRVKAALESERDSPVTTTEVAAALRKNLRTGKEAVKRGKK